MAKRKVGRNGQSLRAHDEQNRGQSTRQSEETFCSLHNMRRFSSRDCVAAAYSDGSCSVARGHRVAWQQNSGPSCSRSSSVEQTECQFDTRFRFAND